MTPQSRRPSDLGRATRGLVLAAALLVAASAAGPASAVGEAVTVFPPAPTDLDRWTVTLSGEWPDSCTPLLIGAELKGGGLEIEADITFGGQVCQPVKTPYAVSVEVGPFPAGEYYVQVKGVPHFPPAVQIAATTVEVTASADLGLEGIEPAPHSPTTQDRVTLGGFGTWDDGCVPRADGVEVEGRRIRVRAVAEAGVCAQAQTAFLVTGDIGPLAAGEWRVELVIADRRFDPQAPFELAGERSLMVGPKRSDVLVLGRFAVTVTWSDGASQSGVGQPIRRALPSQGEGGSGAFWFFSPDNTELLVKVLDGCAVNDRYWVFISAATDLGWEVHIEDFGVDGLVRTYSSPPGAPAVAVTDIDAYPTC